MEYTRLVFISSGLLSVEFLRTSILSLNIFAFKHEVDAPPDDVKLKPCKIMGQTTYLFNRVSEP